VVRGWGFGWEEGGMGRGARCVVVAWGEVEDENRGMGMGRCVGGCV